MVTTHSQNPDERVIRQVVSVLESGGIAILPTDTIYALVADIYQNKAIDKIGRMKGMKLEKSNFSFLCADLKDISRFTKNIDRSIYRLLKRALPGPYTFILEASNEVPSIFRNRKKTIGIRVPDNPIIKKVVELLGHPLLATSLHADDVITEYPTDPYEINEKYGNNVNIIVDAGYGNNIPSTVIDCLTGEPVIIREGAGSLDILN